MTRFGQRAALVALAVVLLVCALLVEPYLLSVVGGSAVLGLAIGGGLAGLAVGVTRRR